MRVDAIAPVVAAAPGERAVVRIRIVNDGPSPATYHARVLGVDGQVPMAIEGGPVPPGVTAEVDLSIAIPRTYAAGRHAVAIEVASDRPGEPPALAGLTLAVDSLDRVLLRVEPTTIRGRRRGKFRVELENRGGEIVDLTLHGEGHHLAVQVRPPRFTLRPGERARAKGTVKGPRRVFGETDHHIVAIVARGRSAPRQTTAAFLQRPLVPRPARVALAALLALALWASAVGAVALWWANRNDTTEQATDQTEAGAQGAEGAEGGAGAEGAETGTGAAEDSGAAGGAGAEGAAAGGEGAEGAAAGEGRPTHTLVGGTVRAGESGEDGDVTVSIAPVDLGAPPPEGAVVVNPGESVPTKLWPARYGRYAPPGITAGRQTVSVETATTGDDGVWQFGAIPIRQTYEVHFAKEGYDSQSFVVTPTDDGKPVDLEVVLEPASGAVGGRVFGPGGPRGGVEVVVTDGTLRFTATTSTASGSTGTWTIGGVSTPGEYTVTASANGLGTEVVQVGLEPGEQRTDLRIDMVAGVGSIGGHVNFAGNPLSGVTVQATNGELTRTTSSLTEGDPGSYFFPKLAVPAEWTVTVSGDGFVTQTRRVTLDGNASRIDFDLVRTTASVTGVVVSDVRGPLPGASITITRDKLKFRTSSAVAPDAGSFSVGDLPPGTYLVSFARFDHRAASQLVTLAAGEVKDLGEVLLAFEDRPPIAETGRLVVRVLDIVGTELTGASVTVTDVADGTVVGEASDPDQNQSTFAFDNVPIGTYEVRVTRPQYRTATQRVSIGLGEEVLEFRLLKLGQVSGRLVDSLTGEQLDNYEITIYRVNGPGDEEEIQRRVVPDGADPNEEGEILWESEESSLTTGTYRVRVSDAPPGYLVVEDQVLDPSIPEGQPRTMLFVIRPENDDPLRLADIEADPFPSLSGRIYVPGPRAAPLDVGCAGPLCPIDSAMTVTLTCPGSQAGAVPAVLSDEAGISGTSAFDTYRFSPILLDQNGLLGPCVIDVTSGGYVAASINLATPLAASDGNTASDQVVNIALVAEIDAIGGTLNWLDLGVVSGQERPIDAAQISTAAAVTGFAEAQGTDPNAVPQPIVEALSTQSVNGVWQLAGQVFGEATYVFSHTQFDEGTAAPELTIDIAPDGTRTVAPTPPATGPLVAVDAGAANILVTLQEPDPAVISGGVALLTTTPACTGLGVSADEPGPPAPAALTTTLDTATNTCRFTTGPGRPGTWAFAFTPPPQHQFFGTPPAPSAITRFVEPDSTVTDVNTTLVELARIDVQVLDSNSNPIEVGGIRPDVTIQLVPTVAGDPAFVPRTQRVDAAAGATVFDTLPVNTINPVAVAATYQLSVVMPGFDTTGPNANPLVSVVAGETEGIIIILLPEFGTLAGSVDGQVGAAVEDIPHDPPLVVTAVRRTLLDGTPTPGETPITAVDDPNPANPGGFMLSGPPGWYTVTAVHPHFQPTPACPAQPPVPPPPPPPPVLPPGLPVCTYPIINDTDLVLAPIVLTIEPGTMALSVVDDRGVGVPNVSVSVDGVLRGVTGSGGTLSVGNLIPGAVALDLRRLDTNGVDDHFPVIATITVPRGNTPAERTVPVTAMMPRIGASITGTVVARNTEGDLFLLPQITLSREYAFPAPPPGVTPVSNAADETDLVAPPLTDVIVGPGVDPPAALPFDFPGLAVGVHTITASPVAGYTTPAIGPVIITSPTPTALGALAYVANPVDVVVVVSDASDGTALTDATVTLARPPTGTPVGPPTQSPDGTYTFAGLVPEPANYTLTVSAPLHSTSTQPLAVLPDADGTITVPVALAPNAAEIRGTARKQDATGGPTNMVGEGTVRLFRLGPPPDTVGVEVASTTPGTGGAYSFGVDQAGDYRVQVELDGYATRSAAVDDVVLGKRRTVPPIDVPALATAEITVTGEATAAPSLQVVVTLPTGSLLVADRVGNVFVFDSLDPDVNYRFRVQATGFTSVDVPTSQALDPAIGGLHVFTVQPQHMLRVTVTTEDAGTNGTTATVQVRIPVGTVVASQTGTGASNVYNFALQGVGDVVVSHTGYRTRTVAFDNSLAPVNVAVQLKPLVTVSGTVTVAATGLPVPVGTTVTATPATGTALTDTTDATGAYSIAGLNTGSWTVSAAIDGTGADSEPITVTQESATAVTQNLALVPRNLDWVFAVTSGGTAVSGASVTLDTASGTTNASGQVTLTVPENGPLAWTASSANHITQNGSASVSDLTVDVALVARPTLSGTVVQAPGGTGVSGVAVFLCLSAATTCDSSTDIATVTSGALGAFSFPLLDRGSYDVRAVGATASNEPTVVVSQAGAVTPNNIILTLAA